MTNSLKGKFLEVHLDLPPFIGKDDYLSDNFEDGRFEVIRVEKTVSGKDYPVVNAVCAGDDERGVSIVSPISGQQITCITPVLVYGVRTATEMMSFVRACIKRGFYIYSESEIYYRAINNPEDAREIGTLLPCPFGGTK